MIVCVCANVSDTQIKNFNDINSIKTDLNACNKCKKCKPMIEQLIENNNTTLDNNKVKSDYIQ